MVDRVGRLPAVQHGEDAARHVHRVDPVIGRQAMHHGLSAGLGDARQLQGQAQGIAYARVVLPAAEDRAQPQHGQVQAARFPVAHAGAFGGELADAVQRFGQHGAGFVQHAFDLAGGAEHRARAQLHHLPHAMAQAGLHHFHGAEQVDGEDIRGRVLFALQAGGDGRAMHHAIDGMLAQGGVQVRAAAYVAKYGGQSPRQMRHGRGGRVRQGGGPERHDVFAAFKQLLDEVQADKPRPTRDQYRHDFLLRIGRPFHLGAAACVDQSTLMSATLAMVCHFCVSAAMKSRASWSVSTRGCTASSARRAA
ncbi:Uncharacterised protein [Bordetella pertussis]|nr:Uncharacterised protein [Bordetella pertussis]